MLNELNGLKVLVVDDSEDNQYLLERMLKIQGMNVTLADNGFDGMDHAMKEKFDIILMDIQMPAMDGYSAMSELRANNLTTPVIALTAHALRGERERCMQVGFNDYLPKPVSKENLIEKMKFLIEPKKLAH